MSDSYSIIQNHPDIPDNYKYYWGYQFRLGEEVIVPYLEQSGAFRQGARVVEIGSAEGGVLASFVKHGALNALATDSAVNRLDLGRKISSILDLPVEFIAHDIINEEIPDNWKNSSDLVILRDVIEHLDDTDIALDKIKSFLKPGAFLYVTFPPYYSPFGGHQHIVMNNWGKLPFIHWLPDFIFHRLIKSGRPGDVGEVKRMQKIRLTAAKFIKSAISSGYEIFKADYYMIRPVFKMKFGLPPIRISSISSIPLVKEVIAMEAGYILRAK